jgi:hypothetical protein
LAEAGADILEEACAIGRLLHHRRDCCGTAIPVLAKDAHRRT